MSLLNNRRSEPTSTWRIVLPVVALVIVLLLAGYFRFVGLTWGDYSYPHPDERFLIWVVSDIAPVNSIGDYFDTDNSTLNPANRGHGFFVYGDFPVVLTRYVTEWVFDEVGWEQILQVGRGLSALLDVLTVLLVYSIVERLAGWKVATLAGLLSAATVLQIQQAHFFTSDAFSVFFTTLAVYFGVLLATEPDDASPGFIFLLCALFGMAVGLAVASKLNTAPIAVLLPAALLMRLLRLPNAEKTDFWWPKLLMFAIVSGAAAILVFRVAQPYAFSGPGFFTTSFDERWMTSIKEQRNQAAGDVDFPPSLQWANRSHLFSLTNMVLWGLGVPLGAAAWAGFALFVMRAWERLWRMARTPRSAAPVMAGAPERVVVLESARPPDPGAVAAGPEPDGSDSGGVRVDEWRRQTGSLTRDERDGEPRRGGWIRSVLSPALLEGPWAGVLLVWIWTAAYFTWQSMAWNPTMRYQLPVYPTLVILAAWGLGNLSAQPKLDILRLRARRPRLWRIGVSVAGVIVLLLTLAWAFAFTRIYTRTESRVAASQWIFENLPGPVTLQGKTADGKDWRQLLSEPDRPTVRPDTPYTIVFDSTRGGALSTVSLEDLQVIATGRVDLNNLRLRARIFDPLHPEEIGQAEAAFPGVGKVDRMELTAGTLPGLEAGRRYGMTLEIVRAANGALPVDSDLAVRLNGTVRLNLYGRMDTASYQNSGGMVNLTLPSGGTLRQLRLPAGTPINQDAPPVVTVILRDEQSGEQHVVSGIAQAESQGALVRLDQPAELKPGVPYLTVVDPGTPLQAAQTIQLNFFDQPITQLLPDLVPLARPEDPLFLTFSARSSGSLKKISLARAAQVASSGSPTGLTLALFGGGNMGAPIAQVRLDADLTPGKDPRGEALAFELDQPVSITENDVYTLSVTPDNGAVAIRGIATANESTWDMGLPFRLGGYDPYGGIYRGDLNFEMYWDDNAEKKDRFLNILDQADYIFMSSNRQWGTTTRLPMRHPLTTEFYRQLLGCPVEKEVVWCYNVAEPGMFKGKLGFDLVRAGTSYPNLGPVKINDQFAEEAFTVYDHAKVMIFQKRADYDPAVVQAALNAVDLEHVVHVSPKKAAGYKDLLLTAQQWAVQQAGGTWAALFPPEGLQNRFPAVGLVAWYLFLLVLGGLAYPLVRLALPGLADKGYPLARAAGLVVFAYLAWILGSLGVPVTRALLAGLFALLVLVGIGLGYLQREELRAEWRTRRGYFLRVELIALALFAIDLLIRLGNPDLWHLYYGGEKPMDFSFFNAVMKSTVFPPYDPWFAGGYINYYYYGYVIVGMPVKLLGITPSVAYNLVLPALFSMVGLGAFSIGWNLYVGTKRTVSGNSLPGNSDAAIATSETASPNPESTPPASTPRRIRTPYYAGLTAIIALLLLGNLGTVRMYWQGLQLIMVPNETREGGTVFQQIGWAAQGLGKLVSTPGTRLPYSGSDWYWKPSRAIQPEAGNEITEFPFFTFLYADLHAHMMALPVTILVAAWALGLVLGKGRWGLENGRWKKTALGLSLLLGALAAGALRPANTWDQYTYLTMAALMLAYSQWQAEPGAGVFGARWLNALVPVALLVVGAVLLYAPFDTWFEQGYNALEVWKGEHTRLSSYLVHWGLFLFVITAWLFDETVDWMARTPVSALRKLDGYRTVILAGALVAVVALLALLVQGVVVALVVIPLGLWVSVLLFRPALPDAKRFALFLTGTALLLTLAVELVAVKGDIGRMNTVFKFYYQAWTMLSLSAAAGLAWMWSKMRGWHPTWGTAWLAGLTLLVVGAALYPLTAAQGKINDRMESRAPHILDGMAFMNYARLSDGVNEENQIDMDLSQDYRAIHWIQQNVPGSPVIVEANTPEYRHWGSRVTIFTGLPGVVGWNWHERQQRTVTPDTWVFERIDNIEAFYKTTDANLAQAFLRKYNVQYVILGQVERAWYPGAGLEKFAQLDGVLWDRVYAEGQTVIYKVKK